MTNVYMVVGLGNPGLRYVGTRHNIGFEVVDGLAETYGVDVRQRKFGARFGSVEQQDKKLILLKPWQYMNLSGQAVATAVGFYRLELERLMVVVDDMALDLGRIRLRAQGSPGGHNGLADIVAKLGTDRFARCRVGIGRSDEMSDVDFVLRRPSRAERTYLSEAVVRAQEAVACWLEHGIETAMNQFNSVSQEEDDR